MLKKSLSAALSAALLVACTPLSAVEAVAAEIQGGPRLGSVSGVTLNAAIPALPTAMPGAALPGAALSVPTLPSAAPRAAEAASAASVAAPKEAATPAAMPQAGQAAAQAPTRAAQPIAVAVGAVSAPKATAETGNAALSSLYEGGLVRQAGQADAPVAVSGGSAENLPSLSAASPRSGEKAAPAVARATDGGSLIGIGLGAAAVVTVAAVVSKPFRSILQRFWNAALGMLGLGVKKMETPEVMAQRIIDQLNAAKPVYNRKVQDASTMVEKLKLQIDSEKAKIADLEKSITAILSDSDANNDVLAEGMLKQQKILQGSVAASTEQLTLAESTLQAIKDERARFFAEREETIAKINAKLTQAKSAEIRKQMAELKGGFQVGDLKDNMDKFEQAVDDSVAAANGAEDSVNSNPDEIIKKAKDSLKDKEVQDEIARRKAEIAAKSGGGKAGGSVRSELGGLMKAADAAFTLWLAYYAGAHTGWLAALSGAMTVTGSFGVIGALAGGIFAEQVLKTSGAKTAGAALLGGVVGAAAGVIGGGLVGYFVASPIATAAFMGIAAASMGVKWLIKSSQRRKADAAAAKKDLADKDQNDGQSGGQLSPVGTFAKLIGIGFALYAPFISAVVFAAMGLIALIMVPSQAQKLGRSLAVIGLGTLGAGAAAMVVGAKLGLTIGAFGSGLGFVVPGALALAAGLLAAWRAHQAHAEIAGSVTVPTSAPSAPVTIPTPAPAGAETQPSAPSSSSASGPKFSLKPAGELLKRFWNALLGIFGLGVKKMETPEVMAQRLIDQLNAAKPVYNQKVRDASTLVEKLKLQVSNQAAKSAELDKTITALLAAGGEKNETLAASALKQKQLLDASTAASQEQLASAQGALEHIKEERARFFADREEALAKIQAGLTKAKAAELRKQMADLKGGFSVGDIKDNMDRFEDAVNDRVAGANGAEDSVNSNPDEIIKKAKESMQDKDIEGELARRKKEIAEKAGNGKTGGAVGRKHGRAQPLALTRQFAGSTYAFPAEARNAVIGSAAEWQALWAGLGVEAPAAVDFSKDVAVAVFLGSQPAGTELVLSAEQTAGEIVIRVSRRSGGAGAVMTVMKSPYAVAVLPKTGKTIRVVTK